MMNEHSITALHVNTYTTEWITLTFKDIQPKITIKVSAKVLDLLYQREQDLQ